MANIIAKGIDVSEWQGVIDWEQVKASGKADFAMLRLGFGWDRYNQIDKQFTNNIAGCRRVGIPFGAYHYSYAKTPDEAVLEAKWAAKVLGDTRLDYPVAFDLEDGSQASLPRQTLTDICKAFCRTMEGLGYYVSIYTNLSWIKNKLYANELTAYDKWIAQWNNTNTYDGAYGLWQYTNSGSVPGISERVDLNYAYKDYPALMKARSGNPVGTIELGSQAGYKIGDIVQYCGGSVYSSSTADTASGSGRASSCRITNTAPGTAHPYHLVSQDGRGVYGWVDAAAIGDQQTTLPTTIKVGDEVRVRTVAKSYTGGNLAPYVYKTTYTVLELVRDRAVIGLGGQVTAAVRVSDLYMA